MRCSDSISETKHTSSGFQVPLTMVPCCLKCIQMNVWLFCFSIAEQKLHLLLTSVSSQCGSYSAIHFENEMRVEQGRAYVSNKRCHEQNRHILVPSPVVICTICCHFRWGGGGRGGVGESKLRMGREVSKKHPVLKDPTQGFRNEKLAMWAKC